MKHEWWLYKKVTSIADLTIKEYTDKSKNFMYNNVICNIHNWISYKQLQRILCSNYFYFLLQKFTTNSSFLSVIKMVHKIWKYNNLQKNTLFVNTKPAEYHYLKKIYNQIFGW